MHLKLAAAIVGGTDSWAQVEDSVPRSKTPRTDLLANGANEHSQLLAISIISVLIMVKTTVCAGS